MILMARPAVVLLLGLFTALGLAQAGQADNRVLLAKALLVVIGFLLFSVAVNDLADQAIDRVNLPGDQRRPLAAGTATRRELAVVGVTAAVVALAASAMLHWAAIIAVAAGLAVSAAYSLRPIRVADRGVVACLLLPAGYVAVPYLVGVFSARGSATADDLALLGGLYVGFIGRIVLKDFRDVRGDALFGKRTFLVRHGRRRTCAFSAGCWTAGAATLAAVRQPTLTLVGAWAVYLALTLWLLRALSVERGWRRDEALISAIAIVGRGMMVTLLAHFSMTGAHWPAPAYLAVTGALVAITLGQAWTMARRGPTTSLTVARVLGSRDRKTAMRPSDGDRGATEAVGALITPRVEVAAGPVELRASTSQPHPTD
jgi:4-hydroxybenzoate polyprenyltransferase